MSAAFALDFSGPPVPCDYPRCTLDAFHDGDHVLPAPKPQFPLLSQYNRVCSECHRRFVVMGEMSGMDFRTCGSQECLLTLAKREVKALPVSCNCAQRRYAHELSVHKAIKFESRDLRWPWSLRFAPEMEA